MADVKGCTLIQYENKLRLLELAQVPKPYVEEFKSVRKFNVFNTNSIWVDLNAVQRVMEEGTLEMEIIVNPKTTDDGVQVIQLETAVGAAMKCFEKAKGIKVPAPGSCRSKKQTTCSSSSPTFTPCRTEYSKCHRSDSSERHLWSNAGPKISQRSKSL